MRWKLHVRFGERTEETDQQETLAPRLGPTQPRDRMATYVFTYRAPKGYTPGSAETMATWNTWFESIGAQLKDYGNPVFDRRIVGDTGSETVLSGYSFITADDFEAAVTLAKGCPFVGAGGGVEVGEVTELPRGTV